MADREKMIKGLECCNHLGREASRGGCTRCPYFEATYEVGKDCRQALDEDLYQLLVDDVMEEAEEDVGE